MKPSRKYKRIAIIALLFVLVACNKVETKEEKAENVVATSSEVTEENIETVSEEDVTQKEEQESKDEYNETFYEITGYLSVNLDAYIQLISMSSVEPTITGTPEYKSKLTEISMALQDNLEQMETLEAPIDYKESHEAVLSGMKEYNYSARKFLESISSGDDVRMAEALAHLDTGGEFISQGTALINEVNSK